MWVVFRKFVGLYACSAWKIHGENLECVHEMNVLELSENM